MAMTSKSAAKRLRNSVKTNLRNRARKSELKTLEKNFRAAIAAGDKEAAEFIGRSVRQVDRLCDEHKIKRIYVGGSVRILKSSLLEYKGLVLQQDCKSEMSEIERLYQKYL